MDPNKSAEADAQRGDWIRLETHIHTREVSPCSTLSGAEGARRTAQAGYSGIIVTDHFYDGFIHRAPGDAVARAHAFYEGYRLARDAGERVGLAVLSGMELRYRDPQSPSNDYLIFGMTEEKLAQLGDLTLLTPEEGLRILTQAQCLIVQAHPFRPGMMRSEQVHGCEVYNAHPYHESRNEKARVWADLHPGWIATAGSDAHMAEHVGRAGLRVPRSALDDEEALFACLRSGDYERFTPEPHDSADIRTR